MELGVHFIDFLPGDSSPHTPTCGTPGRRPQKSSRTRSPCCTAIATPRDAIQPRSARPQRGCSKTHLTRGRSSGLRRLASWRLPHDFAISYSALVASSRAFPISRSTRGQPPHRGRCAMPPGNSSGRLSRIRPIRSQSRYLTSLLQQSMQRIAGTCSPSDLVANRPARNLAWAQPARATRRAERAFSRSRSADVVVPSKRGCGRGGAR
jgi:hypothetical protein